MNLSKIYRKEELEGVLTPGIINNGGLSSFGGFFFIDLEVFENGRVSYWELQDFEHFKEKVEKEWVSVSVPDGYSISVHGLGQWKIDKGNWLYDKSSFIEYIWEIVKELNPNLNNIYKYYPKKKNNISVCEIGNGILYKDEKGNDFFPKKITGEGINLFLKNKSEYDLVRLDIYDENSIFISRIKKPFEITLDKLEEMIKNKEIISQPETGKRVNIFNFGSFEIKEEEYSEEILNKLLEIKDIIKTLKGKPSAVELCRIAHNEYLENPTEELKSKLKIAYENIPEHQRMYVGDMDTKDMEVRMIIYGENEIEDWSHYQVSKMNGEELPTIKIPKTKKE